MRLRNVKNARETVENHPLVIKKLDKSTFANKNEIRLEIGMGKGDFIIQMAEKYPHINFVGIEKYESVMVRALEKREEFPINLRFMRLDADAILEYIDIEISAIYLNFSDPWPKVRHAKRRLTSKDFLDKYEKLFKDTVEIYQKTDNKELFAYSLVSLSNAGYILKEVSLDLHKTDIPNVETEYEKKFSSLGETINYLHASKRM